VSGNTGRIFIRLIPRSQRPPAEEIIQQLRPRLAAITGIRVYPQILPTIRIGGMLTSGTFSGSPQPVLRPFPAAKSGEINLGQIIPKQYKLQKKKSGQGSLEL
jgi:hypothetical protein